MKDEKKTKKQFINELREPQQGITEVKGSESVHNRVEYELLKVNRALEVIGKCNEALMRATNESDFLNDICRVIVDVKGYRLAWIGFAEKDEGKSVLPVAYAGFEDRYLDTVNITWADTARGRGPTGTAIRAGKPCAIRNILTDPRFAPWRVEALQRGYASSVALPIISEGETIGALNVYAVEQDAFDTNEVKLLMDLAGNLAYGISALRMRVEYMQAKEVLCEKEERFRLFAEQIKEYAIFFLDEGGQVNTWNAAAERINGYREDEILGKHFSIFYTKKDLEQEKPQKALEAAKTTGVFRDEGVRVRKNGTQFWADVVITTLRDKAGRLRGFSKVTRDITERKRTEKSLRQRTDELTMLNAFGQKVNASISLTQVIKTTLNEIMNSLSPDVALLFIREGNELTLQGFKSTKQQFSHEKTPMHRAGECLCGLAVSEGKPIYALNIHNDPRCTWDECKKAGLHSFAALPLRFGDETIGVLGLASATERDFSERATFLEAMSHTIAIGIQNSLLFERVNRHSDELEERVRERTEALQHANLKLMELDRLKSMFIASISHELRTPLNSIIGFTGIILQELAGPINEEQEDQLTRVYRAAQHLLNLISDVIDISKIEAGKVELTEEDFQLREVIEEALSQVKNQIDTKKLALEVTVPHDLPLHTDRKRLFQCIINYLSNAVKFTERGNIRIAAREVGDTLEITVKDTGIGIRQEDLPRLFNSFVRIDSPLTNSLPGTGLGLYLTKKIVTEVLGGSVSVESTYGEGSTFSLLIPKEISNKNLTVGSV